MVKTDERPNIPGNEPSQPLPSDEDMDEHYNMPSVTDAQRRANQKNHRSAPELDDAEESGAEDGPTSPDQDEDNAVNQAGGSPSGKWNFSDAPEGPGRGPRVSRRKKMGAGFVIGLIFSTLAAFSSQGPNFAIQHLREQLLGVLAQVQNSHSLRYRRTRINRVRDLFSQDGRRGGQIITQMERKGWTFAFDGRTNDIVGIRRPSGGQFIEGDNIGFEINKFLQEKHPIRSSRWKTKRMEAFYSRYRVSRRSVIVRSPDADADEVVEMRRRLASQVVPEEPDTRATAPQPGDDLDENAAADFNERGDSNRALAESDGSMDELRRKILNGENLTPDELAVLQSSSRIDQNILDALYEFADNTSVAGRAWNTIKGFASATDIADKVCTMKNRMRAIQFASRNYRALSLLRYTSLFVGASDEIRKGELSEIDPVLLGELFRRVTAVDAGGYGIGGSPGFAYMLKGRYSQAQNNDFATNVMVNGTLTGLLAAIDESLNSIPGVSRGQCRVYQNPAFQIGVSAIEVGVAIFTVGGSEAGVQAGKQTVQQTIRLALRNILTRKTATAVAQSVAIDITFEGVLLLLQVQAEKATSLNFTGRECCAELGDILVAGGGTLNSRRSAQAGMVPATTDQYDGALDAFVAEKREERNQKSFFARTFDYRDYDSLTFKSASQLATIPFNMEGVGLGIRNGLDATASILTKPLSMFSGLANILSAKAGAQPEEDDEVRFGEYEVDGGDLNGTTLATDPAGNLLYILRQDIANMDPDENIQYLTDSGDIDPETHEPISEDFQNYIETCLEAVEVLTAIENNQGDCMATRAITARYVAHLAYMDMLDGIDASLLPNDIPDTGSNQ